MEEDEGCPLFEPKAFNVKMSKIEEAEKFDDILEFVGSSHRFQTFLIYGVLSPIIFLAGIFSGVQIFTLFIPDHYCSPPEQLDEIALEVWKQKYIPTKNDSEGAKFSQCQMYNYTTPTDRIQIPCQSGWIYDSEDFNSTIATENNWVCSQDLYPSTVFSVVFAGGFIGTVFFGPMSDRYGRKPILVISLIIYMVCATIAYFISHMYVPFLIVIGIGSMGGPSINTIPGTLIAEFCGNDYRAWTYVVSTIAYVFGSAVLPGIAFLSRTWRVLYISSQAPLLLLLFLFPFLPESPRWLVSMGKVTEAARVITKISKVNSTIHKFSQVGLVTALTKVVEIERNSQEINPGFWNLFTHKRLAVITILTSITWTANDMIFEQLTLNTPYMSGNQFLNFFIMSIIGLPATFLGGYLSNKFGRRWTHVVFLLMTAASCCIAGIFSKGIVVVTCVFVAMFAVSISMYVAYVQATELFPTPLRVSGGTVESTINSIFGCFNPEIVYTGKLYTSAPYYAMLLISTIGFTCAAFLPETLGQNLPETIADAQNLGKNDKFWSLNRKTYRQEVEAEARS